MEGKVLQSASNFSQNVTSLTGNKTHVGHDDRLFVVWISSLIVVVAILMIILNILVTFTFYRQRSIMDNKTVFYVSIAISDLFAGLYLFTNTLAYLKTPMHFSFSLCISLHTSGIILFYVSPYNILMLTIFQYIEIRFPFRPKVMCQKSFYVKVCTGLWTVITLAFVLPAIWLTKEKEITECSILSVFGDYHKQLNFKTFIFYIVFLVLQSFFSIILVLKIRSVLWQANCISKVKVQRTIVKDDPTLSVKYVSTDSGGRNLSNAITESTGNGVSNISKRTRDRYVTSAKTLFIYLFVYMICTLPLMCMIFTDLLFRFDPFHSRKVTISLGALAMSTSFINPMLYFRRFHICKGCI